MPQAAPAIVLAIPAPEGPGPTDIATGIASVVATLCPGAAILGGYTGTGPASLGSVLHSVVADRGAPDGECPYVAVVIPLAITPDPGRDAALAATIGQAGPTVVGTPPLGPHPLLVTALHERVAETGLIGQRRITGLSLVRLEVGVLVAATGGAQALQAAETAAVLLTARLGVPVAPVLAEHADSVARGVDMLRQAGASRLVMAPYLIGPELPPEYLASVAESAGAQCAPALGAHPAIGQLVTMRYGAALLGQQPPGLGQVARLGRETPRPWQPA